MRYLLLIHADEAKDEALSEEETLELIGRYRAVMTEAEQAGVYLASDRLRPVATATTVRRKDGELLVTDGPFAETKEQLGGFYIIDVDHLDDAIQWAARLPAAEYGCVEVRPVWDMSDLP